MPYRFGTLYVFIIWIDLVDTMHAVTMYILVPDMMVKTKFIQPARDIHFYYISTKLIFGTTLFRYKNTESCITLLT